MTIYEMFLENYEKIREYAKSFHNAERDQTLSKVQDRGQGLTVPYDGVIDDIREYATESTRAEDFSKRFIYAFSALWSYLEDQRKSMRRWMGQTWVYLHKSDDIPWGDISRYIINGGKLPEIIDFSGSENPIQGRFVDWRELLEAHDGRNKIMPDGYDSIITIGGGGLFTLLLYIDQIANNGGIPIYFTDFSRGIRYALISGHKEDVDSVRKHHGLMIVESLSKMERGRTLYEFVRLLRQHYIKPVYIFTLNHGKIEVEKQ